MTTPLVKASLLVAAALAATTGVKAHAQSQATPAPSRTQARSVTVPANETEAYKAVSKIQVESFDKKRLTGAQMATLNADVDSPEILVRITALAALRHAAPGQVQEATTIARKGLFSVDSMTRLYALSTLDKLNAPDIVPTAKRMLADSSRYVRPEAHDILKRRGQAG